VQQLVFDMARALTKHYSGQENFPPAHVLFPQFLKIVERYVREKVKPIAPAMKVDVALSPYYGWAIETLLNAVRPDTSRGEEPELPKVEANRSMGSTKEVDYWTSREPREVRRSHLNYIVPDTQKWEQSAAYYIDRHAATDAFVKNAGLGFAIPYFDNGEPHEYVPDFIVRLKVDGLRHIILETKGYDPREQKKQEAAERWVNAVNASGKYGRWAYRLIKKPEHVVGVLSAAVAESKL
jgi:type III restriction enzyme